MFNINSKQCRDRGSDFGCKARCFYSLSLAKQPVSHNKKLFLLLRPLDANLNHVTRVVTEEPHCGAAGEKILCVMSGAATAVMMGSFLPPVF